MRFSCTQENFIQGLNIVSRVASRAGNLPILSNIHIKAEADGIVLKSTNLEIGITYKLRGKVDEIGEFTVPARLIAEYVAFLPKERIDVELKQGSLYLSCGTHKTAVKGAPAADFPLIPAIEQGAAWDVSLIGFLQGLEQVIFTISPTETRTEISGALLSVEDNTLILAGTDSYRLAEKALKAQGDSDQKAKVIIPLRALQELTRVCAQAAAETGTVKLVIAPNQFAVILPSMEFVSRLIDGQYPDYKAIVPSKFETEVLLSKTEFANAVKTAGLFSKAGIYDVVVEIAPESNTFNIEAISAQAGEHKSALSAEIKGNGGKISYNWKYLLDGIQALRSEKITLKIADFSAPSLLIEEGGTDYFYIVMPIKE